MKFSFIKDNDKEEVVVYAKEKNELINSIENMCSNDDALIGYDEGIIRKLDYFSVECFFTSGDKVYALIEGEQYQVKKRLYELHSLYEDLFIYINQGCLANLKLIDHFDVSIGGTLLVVFKSGYKDYASRRQIKKIKERIGIKK